MVYICVFKYEDSSTLGISFQPQKSLEYPAPGVQCVFSKLFTNDIRKQDRLINYLNSTVPGNRKNTFHTTVANIEMLVNLMNNEEEEENQQQPVRQQQQNQPQQQYSQQQPQQQYSQQNQSQQQYSQQQPQQQYSQQQPQQQYSHQQPQQQYSQQNQSQQQPQQPRYANDVEQSLLNIKEPIPCWVIGQPTRNDDSAAKNSIPSFSFADHISAMPKITPNRDLEFGRSPPPPENVDKYNYRQSQPVLNNEA